MGKTLFYKNKQKAKIENAVISPLKEGTIRSADLGGSTTTSDVAYAIVTKLRSE